VLQSDWWIFLVRIKMSPTESYQIVELQPLRHLSEETVEQSLDNLTISVEQGRGTLETFHFEVTGMVCQVRLSFLSYLLVLRKDN
jgi:hypothetical protein